MMNKIEKKVTKKIPKYKLYLELAKPEEIPNPPQPLVKTFFDGTKWVREEIPRVVVKFRKSPLSLVYQTWTEEKYKREKEWREKIIKNQKSDLVKITTNYTTITWYGRGKEPKKTDSQVVDYARISYDSVKTKASFIHAISQLYDKIFLQLKAIAESRQEIVIKNHSYTKIGEGELNQHAQNPLSIKMRVKIPINYKFIPGVDLNVPEKDGFCVEDFIVGYYKKRIPTLTRKKVAEIIDNKIYKSEDHIPSYGRSCEEIQVFCNKYKISMYALDINRTVFYKKVQNGNRNYPPLIFFMMDEHLYPVTDTKTREYIIKQEGNKSRSASYNSSPKDIEEKEVEEAERFKLPYYEDISISDLNNYKDCNIFYHKQNLYDILVKLLYLNVAQYESKNNGDNIVMIKYENNVRLYANANHKLHKDWRLSMSLCNKFNIPFKNQSLTTLSYEVSLAFNPRGAQMFLRKCVSVAQKREILEKQNKNCNLCQQELTKYQIDHIIPISCGGSNDLKNLQALCPSCHSLKSAKEAAERDFSVDNVTSMFNEETKKIFSKRKNGITHLFRPPYRKRSKKVESKSVKCVCRRLNLPLCFYCRIKEREEAKDNRLPCHCFVDQKRCDKCLVNMINAYIPDEEFIIPVQLKEECFCNNEQCDKCKKQEEKNEIKQKSEKRHYIALDINRCRKNIVRYSTYDYCVFSVLDDPVLFDSQKHGEIPVGYYYLESTNLLPLKGNGWYSYPTIRYCLQEKIISLSSIRYFLAPSIILKANHFNKFIDHVYSIAGDDAKDMVNCYIGLLGHKITKKRKTFFSRSLNEASYHFFTKEGVSISRVFREKTQEEKESDPEMAEYPFEDPNMFEITHKSDVYREDSYTPIFNQILDTEAMELHKMSKIIKDNKGTVLFVKTDCVVGEFRQEENRDNVKSFYQTIFWDNENKVPKYKEAEANFQDAKEFVQDSKYEFEAPKYRVIDDPKNNDFAKFAENIINQNKSFQIDARAGCGKTFLIRKIIEALEKQNKTFMATAPTHKACRQIGKDAQTLHSAFKKMTPTKYAHFNRYEYIIVDEKSMVKEMFFKLLLNLKRNTSCKFILCGDWHQLPPVMDRADFDYENSFAVWDLCDGTLVKLSECRRADNILFDLCANVDSVKTENFGKTIYRRSIAFHNSIRKKINHEWMLKQRGKKYFKIEKFMSDDNSQDMYIYKGLPVIACKTNRELDIANCEEFTIKTHTKEIITLEGEGIIKNIPSNLFSRIFYPAYCITVHRSQGSTFDCPYTIWEWDLMDERLKYVALSRATKVENINFIC